ncbi:hypothetical protein [Thermoflavimicrobium daqui]|jgi:hypothetical protein|uniref:Uncharacterized protein n=1 Tax=Thermoflavimicrobium daqui TaxID=2137476 RepID=A0A364K2R0_9BACL|nr:hypothetical protein [Thermoflavimicrobium daqui]RAL22710.1 hypothetical protein DL897_13675 [Thermoflavimicrobium daqui]
MIGSEVLSVLETGIHERIKQIEHGLDYHRNSGIHNPDTIFYIIANWHDVKMVMDFLQKHKLRSDYQEIFNRITDEILEAGIVLPDTKEEFDQVLQILKQLEG